MHRSRLAGFIVDCQGRSPGELTKASDFWSEALGMQVRAVEGDKYVLLGSEARDLHIEVQRVAHESRVHLDIESDDLDAEVARLECLGAKRLPQTHAGSWVVMEAPTGQRFCVVRTKIDLSVATGASVWP